jgi:hypothetical protein
MREEVGTMKARRAPTCPMLDERIGLLSPAERSRDYFRYADL